MSFYNTDYFVSEVSQKLCPNNPERIEALREKLLDSKQNPFLKNSKTTWEKYTAWIKNVLTENGFELPKVPVKEDAIKNSNSLSKENIIDYLSDLKGEQTEHKIKEYILRGQLPQEPHDHFHHLFDSFQSVQQKKKEQVFVCCHAQLLLTQEISRLMLNWFINAFSRNVKKGIREGLSVELNDNTVKYEQLDRITYLNMIYSIIDNDQAIDKSELRRTTCVLLPNKSINYKSFLETTYLFAIMNGLPYSELEETERQLTSKILLYLFDNDANVQECTKQLFKKNNGGEYEIKISDIENFLKFTQGSKPNQNPVLKFCSQLLNKEESEIQNVINNKVGADIRRIQENGIRNRNTDSIQCFEWVMEKINTLNKEQFLEAIYQDRHFYEGYFNLLSKTRMDTFTDRFAIITAITDDIIAYAISNKIFFSDDICAKQWINDIDKIDIQKNEERIYMIVFGLLERYYKLLDQKKNFNNKSKNNLKNEPLEIDEAEEEETSPSEEKEKLKEARKREQKYYYYTYVSAFMNLIESANLDLDNIRSNLEEVAQSIVKKADGRIYILAQNINREIFLVKNGQESKVARAVYLLKLFEESATNKKVQNKAEYFKRTIDIKAMEEQAEDIITEEDDVLLGNRWSGFSLMNYQDAMLYMCLKTDDPMRIFDEIDNTPGYSYFENNILS